MSQQTINSAIVRASKLTIGNWLYAMMSTISLDKFKKIASNLDHPHLEVAAKELRRVQDAYAKLLPLLTSK